LAIPSAACHGRPARPFRRRHAVAPIVALMLAACGAAPTPIAYSELKRQVERGHVASVVVGAERVVATSTDQARSAGAPARWEAAPALPDPGLLPLLDREGVIYDGEGGGGSRRSRLALTLLGVTAALAAGVVLVRRRNWLLRATGFGTLDLRDARGRAEGALYGDVAGIDEVKEELEEVVAFLRAPERFTRLGARVPKGVLLVGPPGTGKTLLARATAGEAGVPFYSVSGAAFVEMFVGVGARRVRRLFGKAREHAPCIVFIDELDAVGRKRGGGVGGNEEREQALNQLLVEMDGFDAGDGIVVMAATNRPEILDPALLRPGRFDRRVAVSLPEREGRRAILDVHARRIRLAPTVDLDAVARNTVGFAGADLANVLNEAAILAARQDRAEVDAGHLDAAIERVLAGPQRRGPLLNPKERRIVAVHEAGHAIVAERCATADRVRKISIVPRTIGALGFTQQLPDDRSLLQHDELLDRLRVLLGGRAAEQLVFGQVSTGAANDLERATSLARRMLCEFGMSAVVGPVRWSPGPSGGVVDGPETDPAAPSAATGSEIDREVRLLLDEQASVARRILETERRALDSVAEALLAAEGLEREAFLEHLRDPPPT
jgi:cell division protease FtsH